MTRLPPTHNAFRVGFAIVGFAFLQFAVGGFAIEGRAFGQNGSTTLYSQPRASVLTEAVETPQPQPAAESGAPSFPSLKPRSMDSDAKTDDKEGIQSSKMTAPAITVASSLAVVLGLFAVLVWGSRRFGNGAVHNGSIPKEVMQPLGSAALDTRTRVTMLRCGNRILVLAQTANGAHPLCEINDPEEVRDLTAACLGDSKHDFASALSSMESEKPSRGYAETDVRRETQQTRRRLFASA